jgi:hypothetical protein
MRRATRVIRVRVVAASLTYKRAYKVADRRAETAPGMPSGSA